jgi:hypothetical protein
VTSRTCVTTAAPSEVGEHGSLVSGRYTVREASTSATSYTSRNQAYGLFAECRWFLAATAASWTSVVP